MAGSRGCATADDRVSRSFSVRHTSHTVCEEGKFMKV